MNLDVDHTNCCPSGEKAQAYTNPELSIRVSMSNPSFSDFKPTESAIATTWLSGENTSKMDFFATHKVSPFGMLRTFIESVESDKASHEPFGETTTLSWPSSFRVITQENPFSVMVQARRWSSRNEVTRRLPSDEKDTTVTIRHLQSPVLLDTVCQYSGRTQRYGQYTKRRAGRQVRRPLRWSHGRLRYC